MLFTVGQLCGAEGGSVSSHSEGTVVLCSLNLVTGSGL